MNYYNEIDPYAAQWIRNLIAEKLIPEGHVDERSIEDIRPADLAGYTQCHFFAGIAGWSLALRIAGIPDTYPIWTGSCPCQPFSTAGEGAGFADERHLWPAFDWLIQQHKPAVVVGEQVASKAADAWIDLVLADLERLGYASAAVAFPSASVGAPHIRDRTYWLGHADHARLEGFGRGHQAAWGHGQGSIRPASATGEPVWLADSNGQRLQSIAVPGLHNAQHHAQPRGGVGGLDNAHNAPAAHEVPAGRQLHGIPGDVGRVVVADGIGRQVALQQHGTSGTPVGQGQANVAGSMGAHDGPGATNGAWRAADWLACRDQKWRPVEPGTFPLANGVPSRMGRLRAYGNAINPYQAAEFLTCVL